MRGETRDLSLCASQFGCVDCRPVRDWHPRHGHGAWRHGMGSCDRWAGGGGGSEPGWEATRTVTQSESRRRKNIGQLNNYKKFKLLQHPRFVQSW